MTKGEPRVGNW